MIFGYFPFMVLYYIKVVQIRTKEISNFFLKYFWVESNCFFFFFWLELASLFPRGDMFLGLYYLEHLGYMVLLLF